MEKQGQKHFPNGFISWSETHYMIVEHMSTVPLHPLVAGLNGRGGHTALMNHAHLLTDQFERENAGREWDGDWLDAVLAFLDEHFPTVKGTTPEELARTFSKVLLEGGSFTEDGETHLLDGLGLKTMRKIVKKNEAFEAEGKGHLCATHDHTDSNMHMVAALQLHGIFRNVGDDIDDDENNLINEAWDIAKANNFYINA